LFHKLYCKNHRFSQTCRTSNITSHIFTNHIAKSQKYKQKEREKDATKYKDKERLTVDKREDEERDESG
jgi:hypothetical protein